MRSKLLNRTEFQVSCKETFRNAMFSRMRRALLNQTAIKQKEFLTGAIGSDKFENGMTEIQMNSANLLC